MPLNYFIAINWLILKQFKNKEKQRESRREGRRAKEKNEDKKKKDVFLYFIIACTGISKNAVER